MPIPVQCACGQAMQAPDNMAGKTGKCPKCDQQFVVPALATAAAAQASSKATAAKRSRPRAAPAEDPMGSLLDEVGVQKARSKQSCPECRSDVKDDAVICIHCGMNLETGKQVKQKFHNSVKGNEQVEKAPSLFDDPKVKYGVLGGAILITAIVAYVLVTKFL